MIQLQSNNLKFSFTAIDAEIRTLLETHIEETSAAFVSAFLPAALKDFKALGNNPMYDRQKLASSWKTLNNVSGSQIAEAYRKACLEKLSNHGAQFEISFQRTLRLPDDGNTYPLPSGLGRFPLRSVSGFPDTAPQQWLEKGGVMLPMYQGEAMWMSFEYHDAWSFEHSSRVCIHTCNAMMWRKITGENPPHPPLTAAEYSRHQIPWFDYYRDDLDALPETESLARIKSVAQMDAEKGLAGESEEEVDPSVVVQYGNARRPEEIRAWGRV